jgi:serine-type D-Ala-D-Ala carboxypeptidase/endopeptidase (penicillin-binding protein 4)
MAAQGNHGGARRIRPGWAGGGGRAFPRPPTPSPHRSLPLLLSLLLLTLPSTAECWWFRSTDRLPRRLQRDIEALVPDSLQLQLEIWSLGEGVTPHRRVYSRGGNVTGAPGSLVKLATAMAAWEGLGPGHRFVTRVAYDADEIRNDGQGRRILDGDLVVAGGGDPTLQAEDLRELGRAVQASGIDSIAGAVIVDPARYDERRHGPGWMWDDGSAPWAARVSAASVDGACLVWRGSAASWPLPGATQVRLQALPPVAEARLERDWPRQRDTFRLRPERLPVQPWPEEPDKPRRWTQPTGAACSVEHPDSLFRAVLADAMGASVELAGSPQIRRGAFEPLAMRPGVRILEHVGPPLAELLDSLLTQSWNLAAECLFQELAVAAGPGFQPAGSVPSSGASWEAAARRVELLLRDSLGLGGSFRMVDGSGLSRYNALRPSQICELLAASQQRWPGLLAGWLPAPGEGSLVALPVPAGAELRAKSGSLQGMHALAGFLLVEGLPRQAFCLRITGHRGSAGEIAFLRDEVLAILASWSGKVGSRRGK